MSRKLVTTSINYSPLNGLSNRDLWGPRDPTASIIIGILVLAMIGIALQSRAIILVFIVYISAIAYFLYKADRAAKKSKSLLYEFAETNNWMFTPTGKPVSNAGSLFTVGHSQNTLNIIDGNLQENPFSLYTYTYATGSGKSRKDFDLQVFELTLPRKLPHMIIDSLVESGNGQASTLPIKFDSSQKIELEGDFSKYFSLYTPDTYGITALTVLAPDAMETLMRFADTCDIEIISNKIYFYWPEPAQTMKDYQKLFTNVTHILDDMLEKLKTSDIYATKDQATIHASATAKGARLKQKHHLLSLSFSTLIFVVYLVALTQQNSEYGETISLLLFPIFTLLLIGAGIYSIFVRARRAHRQHLLAARFKR